MNFAASQLAELKDWRPLLALLAVYPAVAIGLAFYGRGEWGADPRVLARKISDGLERLTGIPGWAAAMVGTATYGLLVAGMGFYNDVHWHVALGRDKSLFTAPHTAIVIGLATIFGSAFIGEFFATATKAEVGVRLLGMRIPYSAIAMGGIGFFAMSGFPMDDLWHRMYGIDVTMWSPTHLVMIIGASISPLASWLALGEAGALPERGRWATGVHIAVGCMALLGLSSVQGEFEFGVPQFQQLYHPVLYALAAGFALTAIALVVRRWWAVLVVAAVGMFLGTGGGIFGSRGPGEPRSSSLYIVAAIAVALVARFFGTERRVRFAIASGFAIGTVGLAGEWLWNQHAYQPWGNGLLPEAPIYATVVAVASSILAVAYASAVRREPVAFRARSLVVAGLVLVVALALPLPRRGLDATATIHLDHVRTGVRVHADLAPEDAARDARWFQVMAWQGNGFRAANMVPAGRPGSYVSESAIPASGHWKTMLRLQRGASMVAIPVWMPADREIGAPEIPAVNKTAPFLTEQRYLLREQHGGPSWFALGVYLVLLGIASLWVGSLVVASRKVTRMRVGVRPGLARV